MTQRPSPFDAADFLAPEILSTSAGNIQQPNSCQTAYSFLLGPWGFGTENSGSAVDCAVPCCSQEPEVTLPAGVTAGQAMISENFRDVDGGAMRSHAKPWNIMKSTRGDGHLWPVSQFIRQRRWQLATCDIHTWCVVFGRWNPPRSRAFICEL